MYIFFNVQPVILINIIRNSIFVKVYYKVIHLFLCSFKRSYHSCSPPEAVIRVIQKQIRKAFLNLVNFLNGI